MAAARFTGIAEAEFKNNPRDGRFKVLDLYPRVSGSLTLSVRAGVDCRKIKRALILESSPGFSARFSAKESTPSRLEDLLD